jgi:hypothetical protein
MIKKGNKCPWSSSPRTLYPESTLINKPHYSLKTQFSLKRVKTKLQFHQINIPDSDKHPFLRRSFPCHQAGLEELGADNETVQWFV